MPRVKALPTLLRNRRGSTWAHSLSVT